jgi:SAM-dependent methyltransferase
MPISYYSRYVSRLRRLPHAVVGRLTRKKCHGFSIIAQQVTGGNGLEIGGPSEIFRPGQLIPVYERCGKIDHCNFSSHTIWSDRADEKRFGARVGTQFVAEASDLSTIPHGTYDFVLASHVLEHVANPLRALQEWTRVLKPQGTLLVVVPHKGGTFDHRRAFTSFDHIEADFQASVSEDDLTHLREIVELHDLDLDPAAGSEQQFLERCMRNSSVRGMHHHVFSPEVLILMLTRLQMRVLNVAIERPFHIVGFAQKTGSEEMEQVRLDNLGYLNENAEWKKRNPFHEPKPRNHASGNTRLLEV